MLFRGNFRGAWLRCLFLSSKLSCQWTCGSFRPGSYNEKVRDSKKWVRRSEVRGDHKCKHKETERTLTPVTGYAPFLTFLSGPCIHTAATQTHNQCTTAPYVCFGLKHWAENCSVLLLFISVGYPTPLKAGSEF